MPRRKRCWINNGCYHITHRCHNREFLFRYKKYRQFYIRHLFEMQKRYKIDVLDYIITSNHVHLLLTAKNGARISDGLRYLHGRVAQFYNLQTGKDGAFWSDRFHSTLIQDGKHLTYGACPL
jgi:putative transposase